jgi:hypothetical protein
MLVRLEYQNTVANRTSSTRFSDRTVEFFLSGLALRATPQTLSRVPPLPPSTTPPPELAPQHNLRASKEGGGGAPPSPLLSPTALATVSGGGGVPFSCGLGQRRWPGGRSDRVPPCQGHEEVRFNRRWSLDGACGLESRLAATAWDGGQCGKPRRP